MAPAVASYTEIDSFFIHHPDATLILRNNLANFLLANTQLNLTQDVFVSQMETLGNQQLNITLLTLAKGLPVFNVFVQGKMLSKTDDVFGVSLICLGTWILVASLAIHVYRKPSGSAQTVHISSDIAEGTTTFIRSILKFMIPLFLFIGLAMVIIMKDWRLMVSFWMGTFITTFSRYNRK